MGGDGGNGGCCNLVGVCVVFEWGLCGVCVGFEWGLCGGRV